MKALTKKSDDINTILSSKTKSLKKVQSKMEFREHALGMNKQFVQIQEVNTGLTTAMGYYKYSECSQYNLCHLKSSIRQGNSLETIQQVRQRNVYTFSMSSVRDAERISI
jgi:hypothetical protein